MTDFFDLLKRFRRDDRGVFAVFFALIAIVLIAASGAVVDFTYMQTARSQAQNALDAAALALQSKMTATNSSTIQASAQALLVERLANSRITATITSTTIDMTAGTLNLKAKIIVPTAFIALVGVRTITAQLQSEVTRNSDDVEVSVSLDVTGSMAGTKISSLITATNSLIDLVVKDTQVPSYSKMAIVPWSFGANLGATTAAAVRGTPTPGVAISSVDWANGAAKTISGVSRANPGVFTVNNVTNLTNGDWVYVTGLSGSTWGQLNGTIAQVANLNTGAKTFTLGVCTTNGCGYGSSYSSNGGTVTECLVANCLEVVTTSAAHGLSTNDSAYLTGITGMSSFSSQVWQVTSLTSTTYSAQGSDPSNGAGTGGTSYCAEYGCLYYSFTNASGGQNLYQPSVCSTERGSPHNADDYDPRLAPLGYNYTNNGNACVGQQIQPLTSDKTTLHALANSLTATGSTSGHLGLAWGWYMISPNFSFLWPTASQPAAYGTANLVKAIVFMTDGDFNSPYCNGVIAANAGSGSGSGSSHINCNAPNGTSQAQAQSLCDAIKVSSNKIILYVVGFDLAGNTNALNFLQGCATPGKFYQADTGIDLNTAFAQIAGDLSQLRVSK
jgi:Flp pilus assembly protein TadG